MPKLDRKKPAVPTPEPQYSGGSLAEDQLTKLATEALAELEAKEADLPEEGSLGEPFVDPEPEVEEKTVVPPQAERGTTAVLKAPVNPDERRPFDDYPTEPGWTRALLRSVEFEGKILEPAAGAGWMVSVLQEEGHEVEFSDLERDGVDFLDYDGPRVENVVTNPPYKLLDEFAHKALSIANGKVALLLPDFALVGVNRTRDLWQAHPPAKLILVASKMKVLGKVSMFPHIWAVWDTQHLGPTQWEWAVIPKGERLDTSKLEPVVSRNNNTK